MRKQTTSRMIGFALVGVVIFKAINALLLGFSFDPVITGFHAFLAAIGLVLIWRH